MKTNKPLFVAGVVMILFFCFFSFAMSTHKKTIAISGSKYSLQKENYKIDSVKKLLEYSEKRIAIIQQRVNVLSRPNYLDEALISGDSTVIKETKAYQQKELINLKGEQDALVSKIRKYATVLYYLKTGASSDTFAHNNYQTRNSY